MVGIYATALAVLSSLVFASTAFAAEGNPARGEHVFGACTALKGGAQSAQQGAPMGGGMGGMMGSGQVPNLKKLDPEDRVASITYCKDTYTVTTGDGKVHKFWERNLRLKTDTSEDGPEKDAPTLIGAGMAGDRADVIFANPSEISPAIVSKC